MPDTFSPNISIPAGNSPAAPSQAPEQQQQYVPVGRSVAKMTGEVTSVTFSSGGQPTVQQTAATQVHRSHSDAPHEGGDRGPLSTARSNFTGLARSGADLNKPDTIITVTDPNTGKNYDTSVAAALAMGVIKKSADGHGYEDATAHQAQQQPDQGQQQQQQDQQPSPSKVPDLPPEAHAIATEFMERVGNIEAASAHRQMITQGRIDAETASRIAGQLGIDASEVHTRAEALRAAYETQAYEVAGPNGRAAMEWARSQEPAMLEKAVRQHVENEDASGYRTVVDAYLASMPDHSPHLIMNSANVRDHDIRRDPQTGEITLNTKMGRMSWRSALRMGFISPRLA